MQNQKMKRLFRWLEIKIAAPTDSVAPNEMSNTVRVESGDVPTTSGADMPGRSDVDESGKGI
jgi:hypothetical protein